VMFGPYRQRFTQCASELHQRPDAQGAALLRPSAEWCRGPEQHQIELDHLTYVMAGSPPDKAGDGHDEGGWFYLTG
jgi:hypothetical protein